MVEQSWYFYLSLWGQSRISPPKCVCVSCLWANQFKAEYISKNTFQMLKSAERNLVCHHSLIQPRLAQIPALWCLVDHCAIQMPSLFSPTCQAALPFSHVLWVAPTGVANGMIVAHPHGATPSPTMQHTHVGGRPSTFHPSHHETPACKSLGAAQNLAPLCRPCLCLKWRCTRGDQMLTLRVPSIDHI